VGGLPGAGDELGKGAGAGRGRRRRGPAAVGGWRSEGASGGRAARSTRRSRAPPELGALWQGGAQARAIGRRGSLGGGRVGGPVTESGHLWQSGMETWASGEAWRRSGGAETRVRPRSLRLVGPLSERLSPQGLSRRAWWIAGPAV